MNITIKRNNRKSVAIKIDEKGNLFFLCPKKFALKNVNKILEEKKQWITKTLNMVLQKQKKFEAYFLYNKIIFLGNSYDITQKNNLIQIGETQIKARGNNKKNTLKKWLVKHSNYLCERLEYLANLYNFSYKSITIISARKKWGSCDNLKNIRLNFRLMMLEKDCIDYVCIHELCHTKQMNHSKSFWDSVKKILPNYKEIQNKIKENSFVLELF